ncbi:unnamed protein product, partial [Heterotrigona itama]
MFALVERRVILCITPSAEEKVAKNCLRSDCWVHNVEDKRTSLLTDSQ